MIMYIVTMYSEVHILAHQKFNMPNFSITLHFPPKPMSIIIWSLPFIHSYCMFEGSVIDSFSSFFYDCTLHGRYI